MAYTNIDDPSAYFQTALYSGTGSTQSITNDGNSDLQPDWVWVKSRSNGGTHNVVFDSSRGVNNRLSTNLTIAEDTGGGYGVVSAFNTDGFTVNPQTGLTNVGGNGYTYVGWQWKANGGTTTSVSASGTGSGCVNACTHQANTTAGFSIITYTGRDDQLNNGQESKLTHGLGVAPSVFICKRRDGASNWYYLGGKQSSVNNGWNNAHLLLNQTAVVNGNSYTSNTEPDSTYIYLGNQLVNTVDSWVGYAFAEKQGYSKFGKYVGNASANGSFIYTGFQPAWVMIKGADVADDWYIFDNKRAGYNPEVFRLRANTTGTETTGTNNTVDHLSNGFKLRFTGGSINGSGSTYIYMAFAENPFVTSTGVPTTAR